MSFEKSVSDPNKLRRQAEYIYIYPRYTFIIFSFNSYIVTRGTSCYYEYDTLHQIWIHIKS
jgi:hypothetical protein